jgi:hypothetical protein
MNWQKDNVEDFFGARFVSKDALEIGSMLELRFEAGGIRYRLWIFEKRGMLLLTGDVRDPDCSFPAIEIGCECRYIEETKAGDVGPVLLFYASPDRNQEHLRLCITRDRELRVSISPHWRQIPSE